MPALAVRWRLSFWDPTAGCNVPCAFLRLCGRGSREWQEDCKAQLDEKVAEAMMLEETFLDRWHLERKCWDFRCRWVGGEIVQAMAYDNPIPGFDTWRCQPQLVIKSRVYPSERFTAFYSIWCIVCPRKVTKKAAQKWVIRAKDTYNTNNLRLWRALPSKDSEHIYSFFGVAKKNNQPTANGLVIRSSLNIVLSCCLWISAANIVNVFL